jgi:three-Cys-motif partner protein
MPSFGGAWTKAKLDCVEEYASRYLQVMRKQHWATLHYVDAFAGSGKRELGGGADSGQTLEVESLFGSQDDTKEVQGFHRGSVLRALEASASSSRQFDQFLFIDAHRPSCEDLRKTISLEYPHLLDSIDVRCQDANLALAEYLQKTDWSTTRSLVFLDPFGLEVQWETIKALAATQACDVWYLFPLGGMIRMMENSGKIPDLWRSRLDELLGTPQWYDEFYRIERTLFGERLLKDASTSHILDYVRNRLRQAFPAVSKAGILRNSKGFPLFALMLAVANPSPRAMRTALSIGNHLVKGLSL